MVASIDVTYITYIFGFSIAREISPDTRKSIATCKKGHDSVFLERRSMFPVNSNSVANAMQETNKIYPRRWYVERDQIATSVLSPIQYQWIHLPPLRQKGFLAGLGFMIPSK